MPDKGRSLSSDPTPSGERGLSCGAVTETTGLYRQAVCTLPPHDDDRHIDNYRGGYSWSARHQTFDVGSEP